MPENDNAVNWLLSDNNADVIQETLTGLDEGQEKLRLIRSLRKNLSVKQAQLVIGLAELRIRARNKFEKADQMFFDRPSLEMATNDVIGSFKAQRFKKFNSIRDICCGIGGDLIAMTKLSDDCRGIDSNPTAVAYANANLIAHDLPPVAEIASFATDMAADFDALHIDPERRSNQQRSTFGDHFSPPLTKIFSIANSIATAIKIAPATDISQSAGVPCEELEQMWIGHRRECKQQVIWTGELAKYAGHRVAVSLDSHAENEFACPQSELAGQIPSVSNQPHRFLYVPHNCVLAAKLQDALATKFSMDKLDHDIDYFTCDQSIEHGLLSKFEVLEKLPASVDKVKSAIQKYNFSELEIKKRGIPESFVKNFKFKLDNSTHNRGTLFLTKVAGKMIAIIGRRIR